MPGRKSRRPGRLERTGRHEPRREAVCSAPGGSRKASDPLGSHTTLAGLKRRHEIRVLLDDRCMSRPLSVDVALKIPRLGNCHYLYLTLVKLLTIHYMYA